MRQTLARSLSTGLTCILVVAMSTGAAQARSWRTSSGYTGRHTHLTWAGANVGLLAWTVATDFSAYTPCHSSWAGLEVDSAWNSASLHNGAELYMFFTVQRSDGRHVQVGPVYHITKAEPWPGHPAFDGQFHTAVYTPAGTYIKFATVSSGVINGGVPASPVYNDTVRLSQFTKSC